MARYTKYYQNKQTLKEGFEMFLKKGEGRKKILTGLRKTQTEIVKVMEDMITSEEIPVFTSNLVNSLGVGIYEKSHLISYAPVAVKTATNPPHVQSVGAAASVTGKAEFNINGAILLAQERKGEENFLWKGVEQTFAITLFAAVPYAAYVNEFGAAPKKGVGGEPGKPVYHPGHVGAWKGGSGGRGQRFFSKLSKQLILALGRNVFRHNKKFIEDSYSYT